MSSGEVPVDLGGVGSETAKHGDPYLYSSKPGGSSMYAEVERVLASRADWQATSSKSSFDLLIAERWDLPYARLGRDGFGGSCSGPPMVNHARGSKAITVKGLMVKSLRAYCEGHESANIHEFLPETFLLTPGEKSNAFERAALLASATDENKVWICKPTGGAHGEGIEICVGSVEAVKRVDAWLETTAAKKTAPPKTDDTKFERIPTRPKPPPAWLVQSYIVNPMLIDGRKFDIRAFALVTHDNRVFWYRDFIVRTCSEKFDMSALSNRTAHISNHCVQTTSDNFGAFEEGNEMFAKDLLRVLEKKGGAELFVSIETQMRKAVSRTVACAIDQMGGTTDYHAFQVLGFDFMPDEFGTVWLLEVNGSAAAAKRMTPAISRDVVELAVDRRYPPKKDGAVKNGAIESGRWTELDLDTIIA